MTNNDSAKKQLTGQDLYRFAMAEYAVRNQRSGYPSDWWDLVDDETAERFDKLPDNAQQELEERMKDFVSDISDLFSDLDDVCRYSEDDDEEDDSYEESEEDESEWDEEDEDPEEAQEREEERQRLIRNIFDSVVTKFEDFILEDD